ncbi:YdiU family protein [Waterburya agarophytonicola K14]|uniref:Protein nucleotidyltransferase YdiU n=1 Tax=Waterburya agarophytonicola KI4 TaxID=2874699 RepID=A0A964BR90_9CYAN|nr:YdiU family protein [Waterburya agarophytonicola]MCC0177975.1 YdiU family protein [Waterburya agarophytonicola KI4]
MINKSNPFLNLKYEPMMEELGDDYYDVVAAAEFPAHWLRFRNDALLPLMGLDPATVGDGDFLEAFGAFEGVRPFLALRYHGYQFGAYNPFLGDGRGFLYGQIRGIDGNLYDLGTKGSGRTPYSRSADGRLTLKGGVREVLAAEALHQLGVKTSRCLSLIETGESLWRGDEPSPTRSSAMVRFNRSHIRFGTLERLHYLKRPDLIGKLLDRAIAVYYPDIPDTEDKYLQFYAELIERVAQLSAQWMAAGFCHGVLNTDNMSITGESFDYGPYAFIPTYDARFTAASFDYGGRYSYGNQPYICKFNLEMLQLPLAMVTEKSCLEVELTKFDDCYQQHYQKLIWQKLGFKEYFPLLEDLLAATIELLKDTDISYHGFFAELAQGFNFGWREDSGLILENAVFNRKISNSSGDKLKDNWCNLYHQCLNQLSIAKMEKTGDMLKFHNPPTVLLRPIIESIWQPIAEENDWQLFYDLINKIQTKS